MGTQLIAASKNRIYFIPYSANTFYPENVVCLYTKNATGVLVKFW